MHKVVFCFTYDCRVPMFTERTCVARVPYDYCCRRCEMRDQELITVLSPEPEDRHDPDCTRVVRVLGISPRSKTRYRRLFALTAARRTRRPVKLCEFMETAACLLRESERASEAVQSVLQRTQLSSEVLAEEAELWNHGALTHLMAEVRRRIVREPFDALLIARGAAVIAEQRLHCDVYPPILVAQIRAEVCREHAAVLARLDHYDEALVELDRSAGYLQPFDTLLHDRALTSLVRAIVLQAIGCLGEASTLFSECKSTFLAHGDSTLYEECCTADLDKLLALSES